MERLVKCLLVAAIFLSCCLYSSARGGQKGKTQGGWGEWSPVSGCSKSCGMGLRTRVRSWVPGHGEPKLEVAFTNTEQFTCFTKPCPQNGSWSMWGMWGECNAGCGGGSRRRHRDCNSPPPAHGGDDCKGEKYDEEDCNKDECPHVPPGFNLTMCKTKRRMFMCKNKLMCVSPRARCDGKAQCSDGTDEMGCWRRGYKIGRVHFSSAASSHHSLSTAVAVVTVLISSWYVKITLGKQ